ncbi:hypothetical protein H8957_015201 [Semnopithecus entellus]
MTVSLYSSLDDRARPSWYSPPVQGTLRIQKGQDASLDGPSASRTPRLTVAWRCCWPAHAASPASGAVSGPKNGSMSRNWYVNWQHFVY